MKSEHEARRQEIEVTKLELVLRDFGVAFSTFVFAFFRDNKEAVLAISPTKN